MANTFGALRLKKDTIGYLKRLKMAFEIVHNGNAPYTNDDFIMKLAATVEQGDAAVWKAFGELNDAIDSLMRKAYEEKQAKKK